MKRIEFSDMTNRLRRNLMAVAALIIAIVYFDIKVGRAAAQGMELDGLTTEVVLTILAVVLLYHLVAFSIRAFEEYRYWELTFSDVQAAAWGGGFGVVDLAQKMKNASETMEKVTANSGLVGQQGQTIFSEEDARQFKDAADAASTYARRFKNFPSITRWRFWVWDIGGAVLVAALALWLFAR